MSGKRRLVGRRFEDFIRNGILFNLSPAEKVWQDVVTDSRYQPLLDRRTDIRRKTDEKPSSEDQVFKPTTSAFYLSEFLKKGKMGSGSNG
ncbi:hypothetical protein B1H10_06315 [candidate division KSB1 bacterium 4484_188]|nr:MAG: hypothetical protein B1H10_06315 [candidate division KSB1 bacterium 4484_188]HFE64028.1 hypothetical protein [Caldithrix sp.]